MMYDLNGKKIRIPDKEIKLNMDLLEVSKEKAIKIWLEDNAFLDNAEQNELDERAEKERITQTIHEARSAPKKPSSRKGVIKDNPTKEKVISAIAELLQDMAGNVVIENKAKIITFSLEGRNFKLDLTQKRESK